jgi:threonine dehydratase
MEILEGASSARSIPIAAILDAAEYVYEAAVRTPLVRLNSSTPGSEIYLKLEMLQPIGSFKIRGAYNAVRLLEESERSKGVWTVSAGNAAQGVAFAAAKHGVTSKVLIIDTAPQTKKDAIRRLGSEIVEASFDDCWRALQERKHPDMEGCFVHPFDDNDFIAGNATLGLEILNDLPDVDCIVAPYGGGGLTCGIGSVMASLKPSVKVFGAEPESAAPLSRSFSSGHAEIFPDWRATWVDGCGGKSVFESMWPLAHRVLAGSIVSSLDDIRHALKLVAKNNHVICEGAGACAVAGGLSGVPTGKVVCVVSGGNIDLQKFCELVSQSE